MLRLASPWMLAWVPLALAGAWWLARRRRGADARMVLPQAVARAALAPSPWVRIERGLPWARGLVLVLLVFALARPQAGARIESVSTLGVDIMFALDTSGSMRAEDFRPDNRLGVAKQTIQRFVEGRPADRLGLVVFAALATTRCPLTVDHAMLEQFLGEVDFAPPDQSRRTAIGMGLATAVNRLRRSSAESKVVVLVTDGENNWGQIGPQAAAEAARALGVKVYTIGVGSEGPAPMPSRGGGYRQQWVRLDEELLQEIAEHTGGQYFRATDAEGLAAVFETIDSLEKTEVETRVRVLYSELFPWFLLPAAAVLFGERLLLGTRLRRIP